MRYGREPKHQRDDAAYQAATQPEFIAAVEQIVYRNVVAFASGVDPDANMVFETFSFEPREREARAATATAR